MNICTLKICTAYNLEIRLHSRSILGLPSASPAGILSAFRTSVEKIAVGEILLGYAKQLKKTADEVSQAITEESGSHLGSYPEASQTIGQYLLPNLMAGFSARILVSNSRP